MSDHRARLASIKCFDQLVDYLRDEMGWPIEGDDFEEITFEYSAEELGIDAVNAAKIHEIKRLRPLAANQPWGIFFVKFEPKRLPVVALRRILSRVVLKKRAAANNADRAAWDLADLLFISNYGDAAERRISFAHFVQDDDWGDLPTLKVLGWDGDDTNLHLDDVAHKLTTRLRWPDDESDVYGWRSTWADAFTLRHREVIATSKRLAERLADLARETRKKANAALAIESPTGPLRTLMYAFKKALIHDLDEDGFADMYAQTITYGLLSARISRPEGLVADNMADMVPVTNPFLKEMLESFLRLGGRRRTGQGWIGIDFDELGINEIVQLLREANMEAVLRDFGDRNPQEDPVIHFYEHFLKEYDAKKRMQRGVFYTPRPVVSYIVRSVHELLQTEFGLTDGLAETATWGEMLESHAGLKLPLLTDIPGETQTISSEEPFVQILDPATGTATFLVEVIEVIHQTLKAKWKGQRLSEAQQVAAWNDYVPKHLLPRLHAFELMMAPYAIAHMKIGLKLAETGYRFDSEERARIYLTNALEPWVRQMPLIGFDALAHEAEAVNEIKRSKRFIVVIGNPPYSNFGQLNKNPFILGLLEDYKRGLDEKKLNLDDDFIKFVRFAHCHIQMAKCGVIGFITNHVYLGGTIHRRLRAAVCSDFPVKYFADLHGNSRIGEACSDGSVDENVFDIQQGVAIGLLVSSCENAAPDKTYHIDISGIRSKKYDWASRHSVATSEWQALTPGAPDFMFCPSKNIAGSGYESGLPLPDILNLACSGIETQRDDFVMHFQPDDAWSLVDRLAEMSVYTARREFELGPDGRDWKLALAIDDIKMSGPVRNAIVPIAYRPFDVRWTYYTGNTKGFLAYPRKATSQHMFGADNIALVMKRSRLLKADQFSHVFVTRHAMDKNFLGDQSYFLPLYIKPEAGTLFFRRGTETRVLQSNISTKALALVPAGARAGVGDQPQALAPEVFNYVYSVLNSPTYRLRFLDYLKRDYARIPFSSNSALFRALASLGGDLVSLHLLESTILDQPKSEFIGNRNPEVEKPTWSKDTVWVDKRQTTGFKGVPEAVWNFHIGGYQVCHKWLKDRKGRSLSDEDIAHYHKIVVALNETIRLMQEIDIVIDQHGGWPGAFAPSAGEQG